MRPLGAPGDGTAGLVWEARLPAEALAGTSARWAGNEAVRLLLPLAMTLITTPIAAAPLETDFLPFVYRPDAY